MIYNVYAMRDLKSVENIVQFFTCKPVNSPLHNDIIEQCTNDLPDEVKEKEKERISFGFLSINDYIRYHTKRNSGKIAQSYQMILQTVQKLADKMILLKSSSPAHEINTTYIPNEEMVRFLYEKGCTVNAVLGFTYIAQRYSDSVFKIRVIDKCGNESIGTGFHFGYRNAKKEEFSVVITNEHVVKEKVCIEVIDKAGLIIGSKMPFSSSEKDIAVIPLLESIDRPSFNFYHETNVLDDIITIGYPAVAMTQDAYQIVHSGEVNSKVKDYYNNDLYLFSAKTSAGNSGGPLINELGLVAGMVTESLFDQESYFSKGHLPYFAAIPSNVILDFINNEYLPASGTQGIPNRVAGGFSPPAPTPPDMRVRIRRFDEVTGP